MKIKHKRDKDLMYYIYMYSIVKHDSINVYMLILIYLKPFIQAGNKLNTAAYIGQFLNYTRTNIVTELRRLLNAGYLYKHDYNTYKLTEKARIKIMKLHTSVIYKISKSLKNT